jgi:23S rRNA (cytidine2498-2'-O)-methyltransferase
MEIESDDKSSHAKFLFVTCQVGAEAAVKGELTRDWPEFRFAYSRPGFLTFKLPASYQTIADFELDSVFARAHGFVLGKAVGENIDARFRTARDLIGDRRFNTLHVWQRDLAPVGQRGFEPGPTALTDEAGQVLFAPSPSTGHPWWFDPKGPVLDCILVEPNEWWFGFHRIHSIPSHWPGGIFHLPELPQDMVSRAYVKMREALAWSRLPVKRGDTVAEIGSAPGGASQALLSRGLKVIGIDPAAMDERVLAHPKFTHIQKRGHEVRRREFRGVRWLTADINIAPQYTLDTVEAIVTHPAVKIEGLLLTLKLPEWKLADEVPAYLDRIRSWRFGRVAARQLSHNRQEICVAATSEVEPPRRRGAEANERDLTLND